MQLHQSVSFFRDVFSIVFLAFCLLNSSSAQPAEKINPYNRGVWQVDGYEIDFRMDCMHISTYIYTDKSMRSTLHHY